MMPLGNHVRRVSTNSWSKNKFCLILHTLTLEVLNDRIVSLLLGNVQSRLIAFVPERHEWLTTTATQVFDHLQVPVVRRCVQARGSVLRHVSSSASSVTVTVTVTVTEHLSVTVTVKVMVTEHLSVTVTVIVTVTEHLSVTVTVKVTVTEHLSVTVTVKVTVTEHLSVTVKVTQHLL
jgi:hypothetical protein